MRCKEHREWLMALHILDITRLPPLLHVELEYPILKVNKCCKQGFKHSCGHVLTLLMSWLHLHIAHSSATL